MKRKRDNKLGFMSVPHLHITVSVLFLLLIGVIIYKRQYIKHKSEELIYIIRSRINAGHIALNESFRDDLENGLTSTNFDILNDNANDQREGLDDEAKEEIKRIMNTENVSFDNARLLYTERKFSANGIGSDGMPLDPKAVTFSR